MGSFLPPVQDGEGAGDQPSLAAMAFAKMGVSQTSGWMRLPSLRSFKVSRFESLMALAI